LHDTALPVTEVAFASGFASVRRFNAVFRARFGRPPTALRRERHGEGAGDPTARGAVLRLDYRPPLDWTALLAFLGDRAVPGLEAVADGVYRRALRVGGAAGWVAVRPDPARTALVADASLSLVPALLPLVAKLRALFDLDAQPRAIDALLAKDARLARSVGRRPGLRLPGAVDGLEIAVRAVLGQQVSVRAATTLASRLVAAFGARLALPREERVRCGVDRLFPTADALADAGARRIARLGIVGARARSIEALARAAADGRLSLTPDAPVDATIDALRAMPGIGPWTASYVAMRALAWPDALVAGDLALRRALGARDAREVERRAERWRPWRAYGVMHVWSEARGDA
jgi:AraC family transcriptional regulator of adaptative response / DNA-3-methyladenine glycosylase II